MAVGGRGANRNREPGNLREPGFCAHERNRFEFGLCVGTTTKHPEPLEFFFAFYYYVRVQFFFSSNPFVFGSGVRFKLVNVSKRRRRIRNEYVGGGRVGGGMLGNR